MHAEDDLDPALRTDLVAHLARVRHDLGRYVVFQQRWLDEGADAEARREALVADLLATRRGPDGSTDAAALWAELRRPLVGLAPLPGGGSIDLTADPDLRELDVAMAEVEVAIALLREAADGPAVERGAAAAARVAGACDSLWRRWRARSS